MSPHYLQTRNMGYLPDGGIKYKSRNGSKFLFGTPEVRLLLGVPF
jgi:hypothetical protein